MNEFTIDHYHFAPNIIMMCVYSGRFCAPAKFSDESMNNNYKTQSNRKSSENVETDKEKQWKKDCNFDSPT